MVMKKRQNEEFIVGGKKKGGGKKKVSELQWCKWCGLESCRVYVRCTGCLDISLM